VRLLIATANRNKVREFREILGNDRYAWIDLADGGEIAPVEETGKTFRENACLKARYYAKKLGAWALADDSGLAVDALGGNPGVLSARWAQIHASGAGDAANNATLLRQLDRVPDDQRAARFVCSLALADPEGRIAITTQDSVQGMILRQSRGSNGFGYDPLFLIEKLARTTAELAPEQKHAISHRGKALRRLRGLMDEHLPAHLPTLPD